MFTLILTRIITELLMAYLYGKLQIPNSGFWPQQAELLPTRNLVELGALIPVLSGEFRQYLLVAHLQVLDFGLTV